MTDKRSVADILTEWGNASSPMSDEEANENDLSFNGSIRATDDRKMIALVKDVVKKFNAWAKSIQAARLTKITADNKGKELQKALG